MVIIFRRITLCLFMLRYGVTSKNEIKPNFHPYCSTKTFCQLICSCELYPNCKLLSVDDSFRSSILFYHNQIRNRQSETNVQPSGMTVIEYDAQLEQISRCLAARCKNEFSECFSTPKYPETSQSVFQVHMADDNSPNVHTWMQESTLLTQPSAEIIENLPFGEDGLFYHNYAQLLGGRIKSVGCAWSITSDRFLTFVCSYGPRGPKQGEEIYKVGNTCSFCPEGYFCDNAEPYAHLCKSVSHTSSSLSPFSSSENHSRLAFRFPPSSANPFLSPQSHPPIARFKHNESSGDSEYFGEMLASPNPFSSPQSHSPVARFRQNESSGEAEYSNGTGDPSVWKRAVVTHTDEAEIREGPSALMMGLMVSVLLLAFVSALGIVILYTHGFGCMSFK